MPKKTREEKILARLRRLEQGIPNPTLDNSEKPETRPSSTGYSLKKLADEPKPTSSFSTKNTEVDYSYLKSDLKKVAILTFGALLIQVALSLTASGWYAKLFPRLF